MIAKLPPVKLVGIFKMRKVTRPGWKRWVQKIRVFESIYRIDSLAPIELKKFGEK